ATRGAASPPLGGPAAATPAGASDLPVLREVLGSYARYAAPGDAGALAAALRDTLEHPPSAECRAAGRDRAATFTWRRCAEATFAAYREAVSQPSDDPAPDR